MGGERESGGKSAGTKIQSNSPETYSIYIHNVLKQVHPNTGFSFMRAMAIMSLSSTTLSRSSAPLKGLHSLPLRQVEYPQSPEIEIPFVVSCLASCPGQEITGDHSLASIAESRLPSSLSVAVFLGCF